MKTCKIAALAASIALALGSAAAMAATPRPPGAIQVPGQGIVVNGAPAPNVTLPSAGNSHTMTVQLGGNTVIDWGATHSTINPQGMAGFNIGQRATVNFTHSGATSFGVLNVDVSGNPSRIYGTLTGQGNVFVANGNGIIVGPHAIISTSGAGEVGLIANTLRTSTFDGSAGSIAYAASGGNVRVMRGAALDGSNVLVSGGNVVNVDVGAIMAQTPASTPGGTATPGTITLQAGVPSALSGGAARTRARLAVTGDNGGDVIFRSGGNAYSRGTLTLDARSTVAGTLVNTGVMGLAPGFGTDARGDLLVNALVNQRGTINADGGVTVGSFFNSGDFDGGAGPLTVAAGDLTNAEKITDVSVVNAFGNVINRGVFNAADDLNLDGGNLINRGDLTVSNIFATNGGVTNSGTLTLTGADGEIIQINRLQLGTPFIVTTSNATLPTFKPGADYSIVNNGKIINAGFYGLLLIDANDSRDLLSQVNAHGFAGPNGSTGSFVNHGPLLVGEPGSNPLGVSGPTNPRLFVYANNNIMLGGSLQYSNGTAPMVSDPSTWLGATFFMSGGPDGVVTVATPITSAAGVRFNGDRVAIESNVLAGLAVGILAGGKPESGHNGSWGRGRAGNDAISIGSGVTVATVPGAHGTVFLEGRELPDGTAARPDVQLNGTLAGDTVQFDIGSLYSGRHGRIIATGTNPLVTMNFTGSIRSAPDHDNANFRHHYVSIADKGRDANGEPLPVTLVLAPIGFKTGGTAHGDRSVNLLVNGSVRLIQNTFSAPVSAGGSAPVNATHWPNTKLVLQSTGDISVIRSFYWPGSVYLGTISSGRNGNPLPGTLGDGTISLGGNFNNVLPGNVAGGDGIAFATRFPLTIAPGADVVTNANARIGFGTYRLTRGYASGRLSPGVFFGGIVGPRGTVNYDRLAPFRFYTLSPRPYRGGFDKWWKSRWPGSPHGHSSQR